MDRSTPRPPCPSPTPRVYPNSCPLSWWCHPTISSSFVPFSCPQSFPASGFFQMSQLLASGGQSTGVSASTSVIPMNTQDWTPLGWTGWISLQSRGLSRVFSNTTVQKHQSFSTQPSLWSKSSIIWTFVNKMMSLLFIHNMLSNFVIAFLPKEQVHFNFVAIVTVCSDFGAQENKIFYCFHFFSFNLPWSGGTGCHDVSFLNVEF